MKFTLRRSDHLQSSATIKFSQATEGSELNWFCPKKSKYHDTLRGFTPRKSTLSEVGSAALKD